MDGFYGDFGGCFVPETLVPAIRQLKSCFNEFCLGSKKLDFEAELQSLLQDYVGRPSPLYKARNLSRQLGANIFLKREDLLHTGAHKINNTIGQALLCQKLGKTKLIAETGAGQHGVATATVAALLGLECRVFMGRLDMERQQANVKRMQLLGAELCPVDQGSKTLKDAVSAALQNWVSNISDSHYILGSVTGPDPYPQIVAHFQKVIGREARAQLQEQFAIDEVDAVIACVGGGSNAIGIFQGFLDQPAVELVGVEAGGIGNKPGEHARTIGLGSLGILHGYHSYILQDSQGNVSPVHSISAGLDYPGVGPEHAFLHKTNRAQYVSASDEEALGAFRQLSALEGIIPALESAHALAWLLREQRRFVGKNVILNLSGRGDKDLAHYFKLVAGSESSEDA